ncbi:MAG: glycosyltransferase family 2 protein [Devosia sp.]|nr:glycosyltransferase family 2 protein [Devosia sp.]
MTPCDVVIVNYNAGPLLAECVGDLLDVTAPPLSIVVVDNGSADDSIGLLPVDPRLTVILNGENLGFAKACNVGARAGAAGTILFLNPDCRIDGSALERLQSVLLAEARTGMVGGLLLNPDGTEQAGGRRDIPTPATAFGRAFNLRLLGRYAPRALADYSRDGDPLPDHPVEVAAISGALMMVRREALQQVGFWDEGYFLHVEDLDLCLSLTRAGWHILFVPDARAWHVKGASSRSRRVFVEWHKHRGMLRFYRKFMAGQYPKWLMAAVTVAVYGRFAALAALLTVQQWVERRLGQRAG